MITFTDVINFMTDMNRNFIVVFFIKRFLNFFEVSESTADKQSSKINN